MRNYIIINGVHSSQITGLIIQELPPVTKPRQRTEVEEIDGRDGDIVTTLGYGAYDKEISIGLSYNYDIDEVISYFNTSGTITFSNEEDKYYNFQMLDQIDFERLLRFRTATVKLHVQPFKYSAEDNKKIFPITDETSISIRNAGNIYSRPVIKIVGSGDIELNLNGLQMFAIALGDIGSITIDTFNMEAYNGGTLLNRQVQGDYDNFKLNTGNNTISWSGTITQIEIDDFSRWI